LRGLSAIDHQIQPWRIEGLLNAHVDRARYTANLIRQPIGQLGVGGGICTDNLQVKWRGQTEVQDLGDDIRWWE
jgi:hypothetical protein